MDDQYDEFKKFTDVITGDDKRRAEIEAALRGEDTGAEPKVKTMKSNRKRRRTPKRRKRRRKPKKRRNAKRKRRGKQRKAE